jgi:hypothetical protein
MSSFLFGLFVILHGAVHLWFFTLSQRLVRFQPPMGWSGESWFFTDLLGDAATRALGGVLLLLATAIFLIGGAGIFLHLDWWRPALVAAAVFSSTILLLFWDGSPQMPVEKGLIGLAINGAILVLLLLLNWPAVSP